jgi:hypothetical protein
VPTHRASVRLEGRLPRRCPGSSHRPAVFPRIAGRRRSQRHPGMPSDIRRIHPGSPRTRDRSCRGCGPTTSHRAGRRQAHPKAGNPSSRIALADRRQLLRSPRLPCCNQQNRTRRARVRIADACTRSSPLPPRGPGSVASSRHESMLSIPPPRPWPGPNMTFHRHPRYSGSRKGKRRCGHSPGPCRPRYCSSRLADKHAGKRSPCFPCRTTLPRRAGCRARPGSGPDGCACTSRCSRRRPTWRSPASLRRRDEVGRPRRGRRGSRSHRGTARVRRSGPRR